MLNMLFKKLKLYIVKKKIKIVFLFESVAQYLKEDSIYIN